MQKQSGTSCPYKRKDSNGKSLLYWSAMALVILVALWLRGDDLIAWHAQPHRAFYNDQPLLINFDGYYYLSLARDLCEGTYTRIDKLRGVPESPQRPVVPPMISLMVAGLAMLAPVSMAWIAVLMPPLLGLLLSLPLALFGRLYGGRFMSLVAVAMGLFPSYYVYRSHLGWFDTDCLNVTFLLLVCYFFIRFGLEGQRRRYGYLAAAFATYGLFLLWWDQAPAVVTLISLSPLVVVLLLHYRPKGSERWIAIGIGLVFLGGVFIWQGTDGVKILYHKGLGQLSYISKQQPDDFPNVGVSIKEQEKTQLTDLAAQTTGHLFSFSLGLAGLAMLVWRLKSRAAALIVPFGIGCLSFLFARRFLIFLNPFLAIGLGFMAQWLWGLRQKWWPYRYAVPLLVAVTLFVPFKQSLHLTFWPKEIPPMVEGMDLLSQNSSKEALVWAWWDHGYPLLYWAQRATVNDGSLHGGLRTVSNAIPLATHSSRLSVNFIRFYVVHGTTGMEKLFDATQSVAKGMSLLEEVLMAGPDQASRLIAAAGLAPVDRWRSFFFPDADRECYLFLDLRLARTTYWWHWFGTWDAQQQTGTHAIFKLFPNSQRQGRVVAAQGLSADLEKGLVRLKTKYYPLKRACLKEGQAWKTVEYSHQRGMLFSYDPQARVAAVMDDAFAGTVFSQLYVFKQPDSTRFRLHAENYPFYQIWKIR